VAHVLRAREGEAAGGFFDPNLTGRQADVALRFSYGADACTLYWTLDERTGNGSGGSGGKTW
jgi:hypothetical protein